MRRRALIIYCDNTSSGRLNGPPMDNTNYREFLMSNLGGDWYPDEILSLRNPTIQQVRTATISHLSYADYTFVVFSGHGYIDVDDGGKQYCELSNGSIRLAELWGNGTARKQTIIVDACRGFYSNRRTLLEKGLSAMGDVSHFTGAPSTRELFNRAVQNCNDGRVILYAAGRNQSALDTASGGAYLLSVLQVAEMWETQNAGSNALPLNQVHAGAKIYLKDNFETIQVPFIQPNRIDYFPFAVKFKRR